MNWSRLFFLLSISALSSCGGGGGGGGSGGNGSNASTGVRLLQGAIDLAPITAVSSGAAGTPLEQVRFNQVSFYSDLPEGPQTLTVTTTDGDSLASLPVTVQKNEHRSALVYGTRETFGIHASLIDDVRPDLNDGQSAVKVVNALAGAAAVSGSAGGVPLASQVGFGAASDYVIVPSGAVPISLTRSVDGHPVLSVTRNLASGSSYTIMVTGEVSYIVFSDFLEDD